MLKLGRKKLGMNRTYDQDSNEDTESASSSQSSGRANTIELICPFRSCGRKFISDPELKQHMQRRHRPAAEAAETEEHKAEPVKKHPLQETPVPNKSKVGGTGMLEVQTKPAAFK